MRSGFSMLDAWYRLFDADGWVLLVRASHRGFEAVRWLLRDRVLRWSEPFCGLFPQGDQIGDGPALDFVVQGRPTAGSGVNW